MASDRERQDGAADQILGSAATANARYRVGMAAAKGKNARKLRKLIADCEEVRDMLDQGLDMDAAIMLDTAIKEAWQ